MQTNTFREATTQKELKSLFRLRYKIFKSQYPTFLPDNESGIDIDFFDTRALHFGIFQNDMNGLDKPVGYFRIVTNVETHFSRSVREIALDNTPNSLIKINRRSLMPLPIAEIFPCAAKKIKVLYEQALSKKEKLWEGGRLCLLPEVENFRLAKYIIESAITIVCIKNKANALLSCRASHNSLYQFYGFEEIQSIERQKIAGYESLVMSLSVEAQKNIKADLKRRLYETLNEYEETGCIIFPQPTKNLVTTLNPIIE